MGGACDNAGGVDSPFHYLSGTPIVHRHKRPPRRGHKLFPNRTRFQDRGDEEGDNTPLR
jgi:hypothetical protein